MRRRPPSCDDFHLSVLRVICFCLISTDTLRSVWEECNAQMLRYSDISTHAHSKLNYYVYFDCSIYGLQGQVNDNELIFKPSQMIH